MFKWKQIGLNAIAAALLGAGAAVQSGITMPEAVAMAAGSAVLSNVLGLFQNQPKTWETGAKDRRTGSVRPR